MLDRGTGMGFGSFKYSMYAYTYMGTKTISLTDEAYERLKACKREGESFSDVVNRITGGERDVWKGFGTYSDEGGERLREAVAEGQEETDREMRERGERIATELGSSGEGE